MPAKQINQISWEDSKNNNRNTLWLAKTELPKWKKKGSLRKLFSPAVILNIILQTCLITTLTRMKNTVNEILLLFTHVKILWLKLQMSRNVYKCPGIQWPWKSTFLWMKVINNLLFPEHFHTIKLGRKEQHFKSKYNVWIEVCCFEDFCSHKCSLSNCSVQEFCKYWLIDDICFSIFLICFFNCP